MNKRNKIILILLFCVSIFALIIGIYLFPANKPFSISHSRQPFAQKSPGQPHPNNTETILKKKPPPIATHHTAGLSQEADTVTVKPSPYVSYPEALVDLLGIDMEDLLKEQDTYKNTIIHVEWMDRISDILKNLDPEKKDAIIKNHTALLYIKDKLNKAYLTGKIDHETFKKAIADLMKWHQRTYEAMLSREEYEALFEIDPEKVNDTIDALIDQTPEYSFILNQSIPVEEIKEKVQGYKLEEVNSHFKKMILDRDNIGKQINSGEITLDQARAALNQSQQIFITKCKEILTKDEINTIFGSETALETGRTTTEPPKVLGDSDEAALGFKIENPNTGIDDVTHKIDQEKLEDIKFFYQQRAKEREELINKLDTGEITPENLENTSREMDAAFEENCRDTLTNEEYQLIFGNSENNETANPSDTETLKESTGQETVNE